MSGWKSTSSCREQRGLASLSSRLVSCGVRADDAPKPVMQEVASTP